MTVHRPRLRTHRVAVQSIVQHRADRLAVRASAYGAFALAIGFAASIVFGWVT